jgi:hypothetical protein
MVVALDELGSNPLELGAGVAREQIPGEVERLLDGAPLRALADEPPLEVVDESECAPVVVGERLLADDRGQPPQFAATAEEGGYLVGDAAVVLARASAPTPATTTSSLASSTGSPSRRMGTRTGVPGEATSPGSPAMRWLPHIGAWSTPAPWSS